MPPMQKIGLDVGMDFEKNKGEFGGSADHINSPRKVAMLMNQEKYFKENMQIRKNKKKVISDKLTD